MYEGLLEDSASVAVEAVSLGDITGVRVELGPKGTWSSDCCRSGGRGGESLATMLGGHPGAWRGVMSFWKAFTATKTSLKIKNATSA